MEGLFFVDRSIRSDECRLYRFITETAYVTTAEKGYTDSLVGIDQRYNLVHSYLIYLTVYRLTGQLRLFGNGKRVPIGRILLVTYLVLTVWMITLSFISVPKMQRLMQMG